MALEAAEKDVALQQAEASATVGDDPRKGGVWIYRVIYAFFCVAIGLKIAQKPYRILSSGPKALKYQSLEP